MWKGKPVIGGETGGITAQVIHGKTGYTINSPEGAPFYIKHLFNDLNPWPQWVDKPRNMPGIGS